MNIFLFMVYSWTFMLLCLQKFQTIQLLKNVGNSRKRRIPNNRCDCRGFPLVPRAGTKPRKHEKTKIAKTLKIKHNYILVFSFFITFFRLFCYFVTPMLHPIQILLLSLQRQVKTLKINNLQQWQKMMLGLLTTQS